VERSKPRVGHGVTGSLRGAPSRNTRNVDSSTPAQQHTSRCVFTVIARVSVQIQRSAFERFDNLHFFDRNTRVGQASDGSPRQTIFSNVGVYLSNDTLIGNGHNSK
jgi:hypothetical protein